MTTPEALNCPNCGGAVMSDSVACEFCGTRLKTMACPSCLGMMFVGSKFCGHCGTTAESAELIDDGPAGKCPHCLIGLEKLRIGYVNIRECTRCGGLWATANVFESICANKEKQAAVIGHADSSERNKTLQTAISYVPCPDCSKLMNRSNFARSSGVIVDMCKEHGVWFDAGELPRIVEFIEKGGLERAREKEKIRLDDERQRLRDDERTLSMMEGHAGAGSFAGDDEAGTSSIFKILFG